MRYQLASAKVKVAGKSGVSQARSRLGVEAVKKLYHTVVARLPKNEPRELGSANGDW
jgi:hypothetical protein